MSARLQAREAAGHVDPKYADAASDVWEPLLRDLVMAYEHAVRYGGKGHTLDDGIWDWVGYARAKEALDG